MDYELMYQKIHSTLEQDKAPNKMGNRIGQHVTNLIAPSLRGYKDLAGEMGSDLVARINKAKNTISPGVTQQNITKSMPYNLLSTLNKMYWFGPGFCDEDSGALFIHHAVNADFFTPEISFAPAKHHYSSNGAEHDIILNTPSVQYHKSWYHSSNEDLLYHPNLCCPDTNEENSTRYYWSWDNRWCGTSALFDIRPDSCHNEVTFCSNKIPLDLTQSYIIQFISRKGHWDENWGIGVQLIHETIRTLKQDMPWYHDNADDPDKKECTHWTSCPMFRDDGDTSIRPILGPLKPNSTTNELINEISTPEWLVLNSPEFVSLNNGLKKLAFSTAERIKFENKSLIWKPSIMDGNDTHSADAEIGNLANEIVEWCKDVKRVKTYAIIWLRYQYKDENGVYHPMEIVDSVTDKKKQLTPAQWKDILADFIRDKQLFCYAGDSVYSLSEDGKILGYLNQTPDVLKLGNYWNSVTGIYDWENGLYPYIKNNPPILKVVTENNINKLRVQFTEATEEETHETTHESVAATVLMPTNQTVNYASLVKETLPDTEQATKGKWKIPHPPFNTDAKIEYKDAVIEDYHLREVAVDEILEVLNRENYELVLTGYRDNGYNRRMRARQRSVLRDSHDCRVYKNGKPVYEFSYKGYEERYNLIRFVDSTFSTSSDFSGHSWTAPTCSYAYNFDNAQLTPTGGLRESTNVHVPAYIHLGIMRLPLWYNKTSEAKSNFTSLFTTFSADTELFWKVGKHKSTNDNFATNMPWSADHTTLIRSFVPSRFSNRSRINRFRIMRFPRGFWDSNDIVVPYKPYGSASDLYSLKYSNSTAENSKKPEDYIFQTDYTSWKKGVWADFFTSKDTSFAKSHVTAKHIVLNNYNEGFFGTIAKMRPSLIGADINNTTLHKVGDSISNATKAYVQIKFAWMLLKREKYLSLKQHQKNTSTDTRLSSYNFSGTPDTPYELKSQTTTDSQFPGRVVGCFPRAWGNQIFAQYDSKTLISEMSDVIWVDKALGVPPSGDTMATFGWSSGTIHDQELDEKGTVKVPISVRKE